jgi:putative ABC transport system ATP-binding protein
MNKPMISLQQVEKVYETKGGPIHALRGVNFEVGAGDFIAIVGPSGSGKSTLINMITGIDRPTRGEVYVDGQRLTKMNEDQVAGWRGLNIGVVFQFFQLLPTLSVIENVMMPMNYTGTWRGEREERALELLELVGIADAAYKFPSQISGGHQQRAAIARALANNPSVIVGDEPTGNLDPKSANVIFDLFERLVANGTTIVLVTHDRDLAAKIPRIVEVRAGKLMSEAAVDGRLVGSKV